MKKNDDYKAKLDFWVENNAVPPLPYGVRIPGLTVKRFQSYEEFNDWKREQMLKLADCDPKEWKIPYGNAVH